MLKFLPLFLIVFSTNVLSENQSSILEGPTLEVIGTHTCSWFGCIN